MVNKNQREQPKALAMAVLATAQNIDNEAILPAVQRCASSR